MYELINVSGNKREYNSYGLLKYEGEYLKGKKNGRGREYKNSTLIYEGEYSNDKRKGQGKDYNFDKKLVFEGEHLNGEKWDRKGKEYYNNRIFLLSNIQMVKMERKI